MGDSSIDRGGPGKVVGRGPARRGFRGAAMVVEKTVRKLRVWDGVRVEQREQVKDNGTDG